MLKFLGLAIATWVTIYTLSYAGQVWRQERNPKGAVAVAFLGLAALALPVYILYLKP